MAFIINENVPCTAIHNWCLKTDRVTEHQGDALILDIVVNSAFLQPFEASYITPVEINLADLRYIIIVFLPLKLIKPDCVFHYIVIFFDQQNVTPGCSMYIKQFIQIIFINY
jgi:hypothetical protein